MAGSTVSFGEGFVKLWLVRTDEDGDSLWSHSYGSVEDNRCNSIIQTDDGGFALAGMILFIDTPRRDMGLVKTDENGDSLWACNFGGGFEDYCFSLIQAADGGFALAGGTESFGAGQRDFWLVKTDPDPVSVPESDFILYPSSFILSPPFPNPFNSRLVVSCRLSVVGWMNLSVYDFSGRMVQTLANGYQSAGPHTLIWNAPDLAAGEYVIVLTGAEGKSEAQKVVLLK